MDGFRMPLITLKTCHKNARSLSFNGNQTLLFFSDYFQIHQVLLPSPPPSRYSRLEKNID